jgi:hypothetical protein
VTDSSDIWHSRQFIERLLFTYAEALDEGDLEGVASLFSRGSITIEGQPGKIAGTDAIRELLAAYTIFYDDGLQPVNPLEQHGKPYTRHITSNLFFEKVEQDEAITHSAFTVIQALPGQPMQPIISGRYVDTFRRSEGVWYWHNRHEMLDLFGDLSKHLNMMPPT